MRKFTFITLVMILGMSSVSFGKSYLCIPSQWVSLKYLDKDGKESRKSRVVKEDEIPKTSKFLVNTEGNNRKMISVKFFGSDYYICKVGEKRIQYDRVWSGISESIKGGDFLTCRQPHTISNGGYTKMEFNLNIKTKDFNYYKMNVRFGNGLSLFGRCEEI